MNRNAAKLLSGARRYVGPRLPEWARDLLREARVARFLPLELSSSQTSDLTDLQVDAVTDIPTPIIDLSTVDDPIAMIQSTPEFSECDTYFAGSSASRRALVSAASQALLYCLLRNMRPNDVVEIGTYKASTTEALCRAMHANGYGLVHTVDPFGGSTVPRILARWPDELRTRVRFYPTDSMSFFADAFSRAMRPGVIFVDGNHDYEFASFDIACAARLVQRSGFIVIDNISQAGPYFAAFDFLARNPTWRELGFSMERFRPQYSFDTERATIPGTDFCILSAPRYYVVGSRPEPIGEQSWHEDHDISGLRLKIGHASAGTLYVQCVLRTFGSPPKEVTVEAGLELDGAVGEVTIPLHSPWLENASVRRTVEPWLVWQGSADLELIGPPIVT